MKLLIVADTIPTPDRNSADFRFSRLLSMLARRASTAFVPVGRARQIERLGEEPYRRYREGLQALGVQVLEGAIDKVLSAQRYDAVIFEWHFPALALLDMVRELQPGARVVVDSVDVVFNRLQAKARVSGLEQDAARAAETRQRELATYAASDLVITVTDADAEILRAELPAVPTLTIPNIHPLQPPVAQTSGAAKRLLFVGSYAKPGGETNIDGMRWFCGEILPLIAAQVEDVQLQILGGPRNPDIDALAGRHVQVMGFVPDTLPYLQGAAVSIAPLRFGGGMKGKIGEAMSHALPVVTTPTGIEGFGLEPGVHALVAEDPQGFATHVVSLLQDVPRRQALGMAGYDFIRRHYSDEAVSARVDEMLLRLATLPVQRWPATRRLWRQWKRTWHRHVGWRLEGRSS